MAELTSVTRNWAGNIRFRAARVHRPSTVDELRRIVGGAEQVRALGSGHSFNEIADTTGDLVTLDGLPPELSIDRAAGTATVAAGLRYADICEQIHAAGFALPNLASLPHISVVGACATATHGSGVGNRSLASVVSGLELIGPEGDLVRLSRAADGKRFDGAAVHLGALGIVTRVTLDLVPTFDIAQSVYTGFPLEQLAERLDEVLSAAYSASAFTDWCGPDAQIWLKQQTALADPAPDTDPWPGSEAVLADRPLHPIPGVPPTHCTEQLGVPGPWHERLPHFRADATPSAGEELQSEFFLPHEAVPAAFAALRDLGPQLAPLLQISEVRAVAAEELWLSPAYRRDSVAVHFTWIKDPAAVAPVLAAMEQQLLPLGARPHWGKVFGTDPAQVVGLYERADDFRELMVSMDPAGKFGNDFTAALFGN